MSIHMHDNAHVCTHVHTCPCTCLSRCLYTCLPTCLHTRLYTYMHTRQYTCLCTCGRTWLYTCIYTYASLGSGAASRSAAGSLATRRSTGAAAAGSTRLRPCISDQTWDVIDRVFGLANAKSSACDHSSARSNETSARRMRVCMNMRQAVATLVEKVLKRMLARL